MGSVDERLLMCLRAAEALQGGQYDVDVPVGVDPVGRLGSALRSLGHALGTRFQELQNLARVTERVNSGLLLDEVLDYVFESFRPIIPYDRIGFALLEEDNTVVRARWARSDSPSVQLGLGFWLSLEKTSLGRVMESGRPRILNDLRGYLEARPESVGTRLVVAEGMQSSFTCPLVAMGHPLGFMFFSCTRKDAYSGAHVEVFQQIAGLLSQIVEKSRLYQRLVELDETKNRFLGMAAHDLRNPIGVLRGYTELLLAGAVGPVAPKQAELLKRMDASSGHMLNLVNDLLDLSAIESGKLALHLEEADTASWLESVAKDQQILATAKGIELVTDLAPAVPRLWIDRERMGQVLDNLLGNAVKYSPSGTRVTLGAEPCDHGVRIYVRDQGVGIPSGELGRLFQPFQKTSAVPTGGEKSTGLGLTISRRIVEAHGGSIGVQSQPGSGSTFTVFLPAVPATGGT